MFIFDISFILAYKRIELQTVPPASCSGKVRPRLTQNRRSSYGLNQESSTFFSPRTPWLRETLSRDPHPCRPKFGPDIHIIYLELSVSHTHTLPYTHTKNTSNQINKANGLQSKDIYKDLIFISEAT